MPAASRPQSEPPRLRGAHRQRVALVIAVTQLCLAALTAAGVYIGYGRLNASIGQGGRIEHHVDSPEGGGGRPLNILVMGEDTRPGENTRGRSDTTILLHVRGDRDKVYGVSLPRDAMVARPDCVVGDDVVPGADPVMFNSAFAEGGPQCTIQTVESLTGIYIDHFVVVDFNGFKHMVDAVGGVEVCIPRDVDDDEHDIHFEAGRQDLTGAQALDYVRERSELSATGDIGRMRRQQAFLASMTRKVMSAGTLSRPDRVYSFLHAVTDSITVDEDIDSVGALFDLVTQVRATDLGDIRFVTVPFTAYEPDPNRLVWTQDAEKLWRRIRTDQPLGRELSADAVRADDSLGTSSADPEPDSAAGEPTDAADAVDAEPTPDPDEGEVGADEAAERLAHGLCA